MQYGCVTDREKRLLYQRWHAMIGRCHNPEHSDFRRYGGRGIVVCDEWRDSFDSFCRWADGAGFTVELSLDRRDNEAGYTPDNCRWVTPLEQSRNRGPFSESKYKLHTIAVGDCRFYEDIPVARLSAATNSYSHLHSMKFMCRSVPGGTMVWRKE